MSGRRGYYGRGSNRNKGLRYIERLIDKIIDVDIPEEFLSGETFLDAIEYAATSLPDRDSRKRKAKAILDLIDLKVDYLLEEMEIERPF